jgi:cellulose synthase/poly-beta-1,6-N-acetylglucosamine synthase-like glycosyltransferase
VLVIAIAMTSVAILIESRAALRRPEPPPAPDIAMPPASAIIAAYLPNEADTIIETVQSLLKQDYPDLQVILAYNTPRPMAVETQLREIAERDPRFEPLRVEGSVSKAQNVNAALNHVRGEFVGLFDADHHPEPGSYLRAWRWIASGVGIVQGHCLVRNGPTNVVTKLVATEFEAIYAVSHPGRARLHGFGIFGGSNGYWRTSLLRRTRMRGFMLTEDIDSSMRVVKSGETIVSDPNLVSTELAPETIGALWNQRLRWAQGWTQVSRRHLGSMLRAAPTFRNRIGLGYLLGWREVYPWIAMQMLPLLTFWWLRGTPPTNWFVPVFLATSVFTFSAGPIQGWFAWRLAHPSIRQHGRWFVLFVLLSIVVYTEFKNTIARTAHIKEAMRERKWKVTPRSPQRTAEPSESTPIPAPSTGGLLSLATKTAGWQGLSISKAGAHKAEDGDLAALHR